MDKISLAPILVTGVAGFIGMHVAQRLLGSGHVVIGLDNINDYYSVPLKKARLDTLRGFGGFQFFEEDIANTAGLSRLFEKYGFQHVVHLAAQAGVRYSIDNPFSYQRSNLQGHLSVLEACRHASVEHLVYASSSSVYGDRGLNSDGFAEGDPTNLPVSLYAASKASCELMSQSYSTLYNLRQSGLRFFTVYGPWGRPDMAYYGFTQKILSGSPIEVFGEGRMARDFTFIDDIVDGIIGILNRPPTASAHEIYNIGDNNPVQLMEMISTLERVLGCEAIKVFRPMQSGDVSATFANIDKINQLTGYSPKVALPEGLERFAKWYREYFRC